MNTGIQDGYNLAWKIWLVLQGKADTVKILETYSDERLENAKNLLESTDQMFELAVSPKWFISRLRTHIFPYIARFAISLDAVKKFAFPRVSQIGINYRHSSLSAHLGDGKFKIKAGDRMPYFLVDDKSVYDFLREPKFHLLIFSNTESDFQALKAEFESQYAESVDFNAVPLYPQAAKNFGTSNPFTVLLRPDNYIGFISAETSPDKLKVYLNKFVGQS